MKKFLILFSVCFMAISSSYAGLLDWFSSDEDYTTTIADYTGEPDVRVVSAEERYELDSYQVPFYVKEEPYAVPEVKTPPVLWGKDDLYYPYQLEPHVSKKSFQQVTAQRPFAQTAQNVTVVCRKAGCTRLNDKVTRQFLFSNLLNVFINNKFTQVSMCEADPNSRACLSNSIRFGGRVGGTASLIQIYSAYVADLRFTKSMNKLDIYLMYNVYINGVKSQCSGALTAVEVFSNDQVIMRDESYKCQLTSGVPTTVFSMFNVDYIDLDYGLIGGYYSIGLSGESAAGGNGYVLMKFTKNTRNSAFRENPKDGEGFAGYEVPAGEYEVRPLAE